jgi:hypothetical protein
LVRHPLSHHALRLAAPLIEDMRLSGELSALLLTALCNHTLLRLTDIKPAWDKAPRDLLERITGDYHPNYPVEERVVVEDDPYQYVADALELSAREDWPDFDRCVRLIYQLCYGPPDDEGRLAKTLYEVASWLGSGRDHQR